MFKKIILPIFILALAGTGCIPTAVNIAGNANNNAIAKPAWTNVGPDISRYECIAAACGKRLIVYRFAKDKFSWRLLNRATPSTVEAWSRSLPNISAITNGVYFDENFQPTGLLITEGKTVNNRKYDLDLSGLINLSPTLNIIDTAKEKINTEKMTEAAQSFPLLIKNGVPVKKFKDEHYARRSFIGTDTLHDVYLGFIPEDSISFVDLAQYLSGIGVKWDNVINLDGGTSTGFAVRDEKFAESMNSIVQVPNVIVAERK
jgi:uncharacterized protein YigE (DUF2233 family)